MEVLEEGKRHFMWGHIVFENCLSNVITDQFLFQLDVAAVQRLNDVLSLFGLEAWDRFCLRLWGRAWSNLVENHWLVLRGRLVLGIVMLIVTNRSSHLMSLGRFGHSRSVQVTCRRLSFRKNIEAFTCQGEV